MSKRTTEFGEMPNVFMEYMGKNPKTKVRRRRPIKKKPKVKLNKPEGFQYNQLLISGFVLEQYKTGYFMAIVHGNKTYFQVLVDPNRANLAQELADKEGIKATAWVRNLIYSELERAYPKSVYDMAKAEDIVVWQKSVRKRIEGRKANKA